MEEFGNSTPDSYRGGNGGIEERKDGMKERWNVEVLAEIPLQREKDGKMEEWKNEL
jgi:hypothetical protein